MIKIDCDLEIFSAVRDGFHGSVTKTHVMDAVTFGVIQRLRFFYGERLSEGRRVLRRRRSPGGIWILIGIGFLSKKTHTRRTVLESSGVTVSRFSAPEAFAHGSPASSGRFLYASAIFFHPVFESS